MKLLSVICAHGREMLTRQTFRSYRETATLPHQLVVVETGSVVWWNEQDAPDVGCTEVADIGVGAAMNTAVERWLGFADWCHLDHNGELVETNDPVTHLHFSDNDMEFLPGWCEEVELQFSPFATETGTQHVGQVGMMLGKYEQGCANVGHNCVIPRRLWDEGLRWPEQRWHGEIKMSADVVARGYRVERVERECVIHHGWDWDAYPEYYERVAVEKGLDPVWVRSHFDRMLSL